MRAGYLFLLVLTGLANAAMAQVKTPGNDTVMKGATIEVIQAYKPVVKQAPKPEWVPQLPPPDTIHKAETYDDVPQQSLYFTYTSMPLHPLALGKDDEAIPYRDYIKLGAGNLNTTYFDMGIGALHGQNFETAFHLHGLDQKGGIVNQQTSEAGIEAEGMLHAASGDWHVLLAGEQHKFLDYGYNHDLYHFTGDSIKHFYNLLKATIDLQCKGDSNTAFSWHPALNFSTYGGLHNASENTFNFELPFAYKIEKNLQAQLSLSGAVTGYNNDSTISNNFLRVLAGFGYNNNLFSGHALLGYVAGKYGKNYLQPDIQASYQLPGTTYRLFAGVQSSFRQNTYEQLTSENPYMLSAYQVLQSSKTEYFVGLQGSSGDHFSWSGRLSYWDFKNLPTFLNNFGDQKQFLVAYDTSVTAFSVKLGARYKDANIWSAGLSADIYHYGKGSLPDVWGMPATTLKGDVTVTYIPKLTLSAYLLIQGGIHAQDNFNHTITLNPYADLGGSGEYQIIKRLSVFLQLNNILNNQYQRWLNYQAYGINIYGGLRLKF